MMPCDFPDSYQIMTVLSGIFGYCPANMAKPNLHHSFFR